MIENENYFYQRITSRKEWQELRMRLFEERGGICEACNRPIMKSESFVLHHVDYEHGDDPNYLEITHFRCHMWITWYGPVEGRRRARVYATKMEKLRARWAERPVLYWEPENENGNELLED